jgi:outer membrane protein OmpA-like peptidoglycan-associated protein
MQKKAWLLLPAILSVALTGCLKAPYNNYKDTNTTKSFVTAGAGSGVAIGALMGSTPIGAAAGGALGLARGTYLNSIDGLTEKLRAAGIAIYPEKDRLTIIVPTDNFYELNRAKLNTARYSALNNLVVFLNHFQPEGDLYVAGFTDDVGTPLHRRRYSIDLAQEMASFLWAHGVKERELHVEGYGSHHNIADNNTIRGSAMNRRVEIQWRPRAKIPLVTTPNKQFL